MLVPVALRIGDGTVSAEPPVTSVPEAFALSAAHPNPVSSTTVLDLAMPEPARVTVVVVDVLGRQVAVLADGEMPAGRHALGFDASRLAPGLYVVRAVAGDAVLVRRLTVVR